MANLEFTICPKCKNRSFKSHKREKEDSAVGKLLRAFFIRPVGLAAGARKKKVMYQCSKCGYIVER
ncbi:MAG: hypothetical protein ACLR56_10275 [Oscillospiraceae bacterium]